MIVLILTTTFVMTVEQDLDLIIVILEVIVLIAGKGHEDYQIVGTEKLHFDDREEAEKALRRWS